MKTTKILWMLLTVILAGCSKEDDDLAIDINAESIASKWVVTETNEGNGWVSCDTNNPMQTSWIILSEDGFCSISGALYAKGPGSGRYAFYDKTAVLLSESGDRNTSITFSDIKTKSASATISLYDGSRIDVKMIRDESQPLYYKDAAKYLQGEWLMVSRRKGGSDDNYTDDSNGCVTFVGNDAKVVIGTDIYVGKFYRFAIYSIGIENNDNGRFRIYPSELPNEICISDMHTTMDYIFKRR